MLARTVATRIPAAPSSHTSRHAYDAKATIPSKLQSPGIVGTQQTPRQSDPIPLRDPEPSAPGRARAVHEIRRQSPLVLLVLGTKDTHREGCPAGISSGSQVPAPGTQFLESCVQLWSPQHGTELQLWERGRRRPQQ